MLRTTKHSKTLTEIIPLWLGVGEEVGAWDYFSHILEIAVIIILDALGFADQTLQILLTFG